MPSSPGRRACAPQAKPRPSFEPGPEIVAVDGKTSRGSGDKAKGRATLHLVSAWASKRRLVLGQEAVVDKENEIVAIPRLLEMLEFECALVIIDAMGCQKAIARTIRDKGADYLLPVKDNHLVLRQDIEIFFTEQRGRGFADCRALFHETVDNDHGRLKVRRHWAIGDVACLAGRHDWAGLASIGLIEREIERDGKVEITHHLYIPSLPADAVLLARALPDGRTIRRGPRAAAEHQHRNPHTSYYRPGPKSIVHFTAFRLGQNQASLPATGFVGRPNGKCQKIWG